MKIRIRYFAILREQAGCHEETLETGAGSAAELYEVLRKRHGFSLDLETVKVAINGEFREAHMSLSEGDTLVYIPPVAGG